MPNEQNLTFKRQLKEEMDLWVSEGLIAPARKDRILARYGLLGAAAENARHGRLTAALSVAGSLLAATGVLFFISANWSGMDNWGKLTLIFLPMLACYWTGFYLRYETKRYPKIGASLILLGSCIFGVGIFLIGRIYQIDVLGPSGPFLWAIGVIPLAYFLRLKLLITFAIAALLLGLSLQSFYRLGEVPDSGVLLFGKLPWAALLLMAGVSLWGVGLMHKGFKSLRFTSGPYIVVGALVTYIVGFLLTFEGAHGNFLSENLIVFYIPILFLFIASILIRMLSRSKERDWNLEALFLAAVLGVILFPSVYLPYGRFLPQFRLVANLDFALATIILVILGYVRRYPAYVNMGILFFGGHILARYFDFFGPFLPKPVFFIGGGVILIGGGLLLERRRRRALASIPLAEEG